MKLTAGTAELILAPQTGGSVVSWTIAGQPILRHANPEATDARGNACYPLVPFSNRVAGRRFSFAGQTYELPALLGEWAIHGAGWQCAWTAEAISHWDATLTLDYPGGTLWPFAFRATQRFELESDRLLVTTIFPTSLTDIALAALAYRYDIGATVRARSVVEPWSLSIAAGAVWFIAPLKASGLSIAYIISIFASAVAALHPLWRSYGPPHRWRPHPLVIGRLALSTMPLAVADAVEWGTRKLDIAILGQFASPTSVGVYYVAQQVASLPQKLKTSFEPILGPVITRNLKERNFPAIARQVCQVGFWITAAQAGIAMALGIPGHGVLGLVGPQFVGGDLALAFLLLAEVGAATAVVSEAALIYIAPVRNLAISLFTIGLQGALTVTGMYVDTGLGLDQFARASSAAGALMVTLCIASLVKSWLLSRYLQQRINNWRWSLIGAAVPAAAVGWFATNYLPEWAEIIFGIPAILGVYSLVIWNYGFGPSDRVLFRRDASAQAPG